MSAGSATTGHTTTESKELTVSTSHKVKTTLAPDTTVELASDAELADLQAYGLVAEYVSGPAKRELSTTKKES
jgi:hypothetical protein